MHFQSDRVEFIAHSLKAFQVSKGGGSPSLLTRVGYKNISFPRKGLTSAEGGGPHLAEEKYPAKRRGDDGPWKYKHNAGCIDETKCLDDCSRRATAVCTAQPRYHPLTALSCLDTRVLEQIVWTCNSQGILYQHRAGKTTGRSIDCSTTTDPR